MIKNCCRSFANFIGRYLYPKKSFSQEQKKSQEDLAIELLERWLAKHPRPDEKCLWISGRKYSSRELVEEVKSRSRIGIDHLHSMIELGLRDMLRKFTEEPVTK
jgi:hypothetical protein